MMNTLPFNDLVRLSGPEASLRPQYETLLSILLRSLWRRKWMIGAFALLGLLAGLLLLAVMEKQYGSEALVRLSLATDEGRGTGAAQGGVSLEAAAMVESEAGIIRSRAIARRVAQHLGLYDNSAFAASSTSAELTQWLRSTFGETSAAAEIASGVLGTRENVTHEDAVMLSLSRNLTVRNDIRSYLISISYVSSDAEFAARAANAFAEEYLQSRIETSFNNARRSVDWLAGQMREARASLENAEERIRDFRRDTGFLEAGAGGPGLQEQRLRDLNTQLSAATLTRIQQETRLARVREVASSGNIPAASDIAGSPAVQSLIQNEVAAKQEVDRLAASLAARHPLLTRARSELEDVQQRLAEEVGRAMAVISGDVASARAAEEELRGQVDVLQAAMIDGRARESELRQLQGEADAIRERLRVLTENHEASSALAELKPVAAELVAPAETVSIPISPKPRVVLAVAFLAMLGGGAGLALLMERRDTGFRSSREAEDQLDTKCLAMIPLMTSRGGGRKDPAVGEAVRSLVIAAGLDVFRTQATVTVITSSVPGEGKSSLLIALAKTLVEGGARVLVIADARLRPPAGELPNLSSVEAVAAARDGGRAFFEKSRMHHPLVLYRNSATRSVDGKSTASELEACIQHARQHLDVVLVEAPPALLAAESAVLARAADIVLYAVCWNKTPRRVVSAALRHLRSFGATVSGLVITGVDLKEHKKHGLVDQAYFYREYKKNI